MATKKFNCDICNYHSSKPYDWINHCNTAKHKNKGAKKPRNCTLCDYSGLTHWNLKMHLLSVHSTKEEREQSKYYCKDCEQVFFCSAYMKSHNNGIHHKNMVLANQLSSQINLLTDKNNIIC